MIDSARLGAVVDECTAGASELMVEGDSGGHAAEAREDAFARAGEGARAVAFEREQVFAGPEDRLDPLADRREMRPVAGLVLAAWAHDRGVALADGGGEVAAGVALVAQQRFSAAALAAFEQYEADLAFVDLGGGELERAWCAVGREDRVQPEAPEEPRVTRAPAVVGGVAQGGASDRLTASRALDRGAVDQQRVVIKARALAGEDAHQPLQRFGQPAAAFEIPRLLGQLREQVAQALAGDREEPSVRRDPHDRLRDAQRDDLRVCDPSGGVVLPLGQQIEVGVHRGPHRSAMQLSTADFDPAAPNPSTNTAPAVESTI